jgi:OHCU decarboxylase
MLTISDINKMSDVDLWTELAKCCGSKTWVKLMLENHPYNNMEDFFLKASHLWFSVNTEDCLEAYSHHPQIGDVESLKKKFAFTANWSKNEQAGVNNASLATLSEIKNLNEQYFKKNGFIFLICASGKSADEMLSFLKERINNSRDKELEIAAQEQNKIIKIRLEKFLNKEQA